MREAAEDPRPIREYAWVPVIRLHLDILSLARTPPRISVSLTRTKRNALLGNSVVRRRGSEKKKKKMQMQSLRRRTNDDVSIFESRIADITRAKKN